VTVPGEAPWSGEHGGMELKHHTGVALALLSVFLIWVGCLAAIGAAGRVIDGPERHTSINLSD